jgi:hypothetical protein
MYYSVTEHNDVQLQIKHPAGFISYSAEMLMACSVVHICTLCACTYLLTSTRNVQPFHP